MVTDYRAIYTAGGHANTTVYPGVADMLSQLGGLKSNATTKGTPTTKVILEKFGLMPYFNHIQGTDGFPAKPEPDVILKPKNCSSSGSNSTCGSRHFMVTARILRDQNSRALP